MTIQQDTFTGVHGLPVYASSSAVHSFHFAEEHNFIIVWFHSKLDEPYLYPCTADQYHDMVNAPSLGAWVSKNLVNANTDFIRGMSAEINGVACANFEVNGHVFEVSFYPTPPAPEIPSWCRNSITFSAASASR